MADDSWMPFFHALFWFVTKLFGLLLVIYAVVAGAPLLMAGGEFFQFVWRLLLAVALPGVFGAWMLLSNAVYSMVTGRS